MVEYGDIVFKLSDETKEDIRLLINDITQVNKYVSSLLSDAKRDLEVRPKPIYFKIMQALTIIHEALNRAKGLLLFSIGEIFAEEAKAYRKYIKRRGRLSETPTLKLPQLIELGHIVKLLAKVQGDLRVTNSEEPQTLCDVIVAASKHKMDERISHYDENLCKHGFFTKTLPSIITKLSELLSDISRELNQKCSCKTEI